MSKDLGQIDDELAWLSQLLADLESGRLVVDHDPVRNAAEISQLQQLVAYLELALSRLRGPAD